ncbi:NAC domain containing protein [Melia azedarach]|uniref:NAC domain containing protein n=1 Tax=Melia azedarach TaxID=155640 RepID=A0ACC1XLE3_MELAZ|nr:NAC domain containing protein [Melia azedarach]
MNKSSIMWRKKRLDPENFSVHMIQEIDIYSYEPWDLPGMESEEQVLYIFSEPCYKYNKSKRAHRRTNEGYWKVTGEGSDINEIGRKRILSFYHRRSKTGWVMHEFYIFKEDSRYKKDFVLCRVEKKRDNKHGASTTNAGQSNQQLVFCSTQPVTENTISEAVPVEQPSNNWVSDSNQVTENIFSKIQPLPSDPATSYRRNQGEENTFLFSQLLSSDHLTSSSGNHVARNGSPESQLPPNHIMISCPANNGTENASAESQPPPNHAMIPYSGNHFAENGPPEFAAASTKSQYDFLLWKSCCLNMVLRSRSSNHQMTI